VHHIAIIGAGELGGLVAQVLARRNAAGDIRLIDATGRIAEGKALDLTQAAPIEGSATRISGATDISRAAGTDVVVVADQSSGGDWTGDPGLATLKRLADFERRAVIVGAGATHRELVERGVRELHIPRARLFGSAPEALAAAVRAMVALEADASPRDVSLCVLGVPPSRFVIPWEDATLGGFALTRVLDAPALRRLETRAALLWPPGPYALASAAAQVIEMVLGHSRRLASCFVAPDDESGARARAAALQVGVERTGIAWAGAPALSVHERVLLDNAMLL
jgi:malate dehydrogenase